MRLEQTSSKATFALKAWVLSIACMAFTTVLRSSVVRLQGVQFTCCA